MSVSLTEAILQKSLNYLEKIPKTKRKSIGQFFTSAETAQYMASLFVVPQKKYISVLDPGAGSGILSAAVIERLQKETHIKHISITCYETSCDVLPLLKSNLAYLKTKSNILIDFKIIEDNYITSQSDDFNQNILASKFPKKYDLIICNPPYKKIAKDAVEAKSMQKICYGSPNLYFLFTAMGLFNLDKYGEMVYIIPRSWTSGAYFQRFRKYLLENGTLKHIHLFVSRDKVFEEENVLQETIIIKVDKSKTKDTIKITCSKSNSDFNSISAIEVPYSTVVAGEDKYVYLVTNADELRILQSLNKWNNTLLTLGLKMRTGITVDFRSREYLKNQPEDNTVPLLYSQHIKNGRVVFPIEKEFEYITTEKTGLVQRNKNYLLVKRFTSKEEKRRLQCGIYLSNSLPKYNCISTQNKVNFVEGVTFDMTEKQVYGLYAIFNSTIYDNYYRILNGSTQVNSTEINSMPIPDLNDIEKLGTSLIDADDLSVNICDKILGVLING